MSLFVLPKLLSDEQEAQIVSAVHVVLADIHAVDETAITALNKFLAIDLPLPWPFKSLEPVREYAVDALAVFTKIESSMAALEAVIAKFSPPASAPLIK